MNSRNASPPSRAVSPAIWPIWIGPPSSRVETRPVARPRTARTTCVEAWTVWLHPPRIAAPTPTERRIVGSCTANPIRPTSRGLPSASATVSTRVFTWSSTRVPARARETVISCPGRSEIRSTTSVQTGSECHPPPGRCPHFHSCSRRGAAAGHRADDRHQRRELRYQRRGGANPLLQGIAMQGQHDRRLAGHLDADRVRRSRHDRVADILQASTGRSATAMMVSPAGAAPAAAPPGAGCRPAGPPRPPGSG